MKSFDGRGGFGSERVCTALCEQVRSMARGGPKPLKVKSGKPRYQCENQIMAGAAACCCSMLEQP